MSRILKDKEIGDLLDLERDYTYPCSDGSFTTTIDCRPALKAQDEISFKAGIKEVVKWVERYSESDGNNPLEFSIFPEKEWQSQKKEWILIPKTRRVGMILDLL